MMRALCRAAVLLALALPPAAATAAPDTAYNRGVAAFVAKDYEAARKHWAQAVEENETSAYNNLGYLYYMGWGGKADLARAASLWRTAAERGHAESQAHLGEMCEQGEGVPRDLVQAYAWYRSSLANSDAPEDDDDRKVLDMTRRALIRLLGTIPIEQLGESEKLAREFIRAYRPRSR